MDHEVIKESVSVMSPLIQYGFGGLCLILIAVIVWLISRLLKILEETNKVITANTAAVAKVNDKADTLSAATYELKDELLRRPCVARFAVEQGG